MSHTERCGDCKFFLPLLQRPGDGLCRRFPASVLSKEANGVTMTTGQFPPMSDDGWCGEYKLKIVPAWQS